MVRHDRTGMVVSNFQLREDSEESILENEVGENELNTLTVRSLLNENYVDTENDVFYRNENENTNVGKKKKKEKRKRRKPDETKRASTAPRKIVNLPASQPYIRIVDGEERLCFKYNTKVSESALNAMPRADLEDNEFIVRFDLETVDIDKLNEKFKADNCVYPRANVTPESYTGNRWEYETECNRLAWQFVSLNPILLYGKKGLIQRAVDSYRNINKQSRSRRVVKQDKVGNTVIKRRHSDSAPLTVNLYWTVKGLTRKCKIRVDIEGVNYDKIDEEFKAKYSVFADEFDDRSFGLEKWESKNIDNELAVKIAYLNVDNTSFWNAVKANDKITMLRKAVEAYKNRREDYDDEDEECRTDISEVVSKTLDKTYENEEDEGFDENFYFLDSKSNKFAGEKNIY
ncbi:hypothetical protein CWI38_0608p0010 [Hamiltosporidium tvaerminnensis]|uniref:DUF8032 domain-containing protein n=2 Tax=Hamiltosporidium TaxID=1176354 RepID=A0A4Q9LGW6_9MICR|nr:hypothetical protein LUQ84_002261 [Hamiltosporidium tvaerminnensis]TBU03188.1 hypothetical protein CWI37_0339p0010 [Hamiltosporidium tvaerminnensis]TBU07187.1 hypothetical protein CWI36_0313p0040 [Hamiltosporidium magnivora]TBU08107.1 hypothetical protein CWI39_0225p0040 [Hamiltosporidium magnivora]TBU12839.1 hypothetical protein CWI38_0608p0010 [Hamiltosporidium tvaerminnensis]